MLLSTRGMAGHNSSRAPNAAVRPHPSESFRVGRRRGIDPQPSLAYASGYKPSAGHLVETRLIVTRRVSEGELRASNVDTRLRREPWAVLCNAFGVEDVAQPVEIEETESSVPVTVTPKFQS